jgi:poly(glycerol-phosphate) alpha-glucosyltransferase
MSVLEAMACRLPLLLTPGCNFPEVQACDAGLEVPPDAEGTARGLQQLLGMSDANRKQMGARGRRLLEERYTWDHVAGQMMAVYRWLVDGGPAPATARMN